MYAEIQAAIASTRLLGDIITSSRDLRNYNELAGAVSEVNAKLMQATAVALASQEKQVALITHIQELENEVKSLKDWKAESQKYAAVEIARGVFVYIDKEANGVMHSMHNFCSNCFNQGIKSLLQQSNEPLRERGLNCHRCKSKLVFKAYFDEMSKT
jgi:hypothetical protein